MFVLTKFKLKNNHSSWVSEQERKKFENSIQNWDSHSQLIISWQDFLKKWEVPQLWLRVKKIHDETDYLVWYLQLLDYRTETIARVEVIFQNLILIIVAPSNSNSCNLKKKLVILKICDSLVNFYENNSSCFIFLSKHRMSILNSFWTTYLMEKKRENFWNF